MSIHRRIATAAAVLVLAILSLALAGSATGATAHAGAGDPLALLAAQQIELTVAGGQPQDIFGYSVALDGDTALVGAPYNGSFRGAAFVFTRSGGVWSQEATLTAWSESFGDRFGYSVALCGDTALVGSDGCDSYRGAAFVFTRSGGVWSQEATLTAPVREAADYFGSVVSLCDGTALVGAHGRAGFEGVAYVFARSGGGWSQEATLTAPGGAAGDDFGGAVSLTADTALVGASGRDATRGAAYVFARSGGGWPQEATLRATDGMAGDQFGVSVALSGDDALVGAWQRDSGRGAAYVFTRSGGIWSEEATLAPTEGDPYDMFGMSVALSGATAVIGADGRDSQRGAAYVFARTGGDWSRRGGTLTAEDASGGDDFGYAVAVDGLTALAGAPGRDSNRGAAFVFGPYEVTPSVVGGHGAITPGAVQTVPYGATPTFTFRPDTGYEVQTVRVNGVPLDPTPLRSYTFPPVEEDATISVEFAQQSFPVTALAVTGGGSVSPAGTSWVPWGGSLTVLVAPAPHYRVARLTVDGLPVSLKSGAYTFASVTRARRLEAAFALESYAVSPSVVRLADGRPHGTISPAAARSYDWGATPRFSFTPEAGYAVAEVRVDGVQVLPTPRASYAFRALTGPHTISVRFAKGYVPGPQ